MKSLIPFATLFYCLNLWAGAPPTQPADSSHPGSADYVFDAFTETFEVDGRKIDYYAPKNGTNYPLIVFGHGQALNKTSYDESFVHLARKGVAVAFPKYDNGFFDQNWQRMAKDFVKLAKATIDRDGKINKQAVVFSGHSKGAYVAMMAAGVPDADQLVEPGAVVIFAPAGLDQKHIERVEAHVPVSIFWGEEDTIVKENISTDIYGKLNVDFKQYIRVRSYQTTPAVAADHMFVLTKGGLFGGPNGVTALHYYGFWKWLVGAAWDLENGGLLNNPYLYGDKTLATGIDGIKHTGEKNRP